MRVSGRIGPIGPEHRGGAGGWQEHAPGRCALGARAIPKLQFVPPGARSRLQAAQRPHRATFVARRPRGAGRALSGGLGATRSAIFGATSLAQPRGELGRPSGRASDPRRARTAAETLSRRSRDAGRLCLTLSRLLGVITCRLAEFPMCFSACLPVIYTLFTCFFTVLYTHFTRLFKPI